MPDVVNICVYLSFGFDCRSSFDMKRPFVDTDAPDILDILTPKVTLEEMSLMATKMCHEN